MRKTKEKVFFESLQQWRVSYLSDNANAIITNSKDFDDDQIDLSSVLVEELQRVEGGTKKHKSTPAQTRSKKLVAKC